MFKWREPVSALTHLIGCIIAIPCGIFLIMLAHKNSNTVSVVSLAIFSVSLFLLYLASTLYHMLPVSPPTVAVLKRIDHMMIFVLIAGTYTPICLITLRGKWGTTLLCIAWGIAIIGIILKAVWFKAPRWISTSIYVIMGWIVVIVFVPLTHALPVGGIVLLALGGISYTAGAVIYAIKKPNFNFKYFGFHEIFHVFVMLGSLFHILLMYIYVL